jgi:hypothetical protein
MADELEQRVVIEYGREHVYLYLADATGKVKDEEVFRQPYRLDRQDVKAEAREVFDLVYQHLLDTVTPTARDDDEGVPSDEED